MRSASAAVGATRVAFADENENFLQELTPTDNNATIANRTIFVISHDSLGNLEDANICVRNIEAPPIMLCPGLAASSARFAWTRQFPLAERDKTLLGGALLPPLADTADSDQRKRRMTVDMGRRLRLANGMLKLKCLCSARGTRLA